MNLRFIETFLWVARLGSFSAAAERLGATQASVSHRIATLEDELGVTLFDRDPRAVTPTPIGRQAVPRAEEIMRAVDAFRLAIAEPGRLEGTISIGTNDVIAHTLLPRIIGRVRERFPGSGVEPVGTTPEQLAGIIKSEMARLGRLIPDAGIGTD